jgi:hypothetical protein
MVKREKTLSAKTVFERFEKLARFPILSFLYIFKKEKQNLYKAKTVKKPVSGLSNRLNRDLKRGKLPGF